MMKAETSRRETFGTLLDTLAGLEPTTGEMGAMLSALANPDPRLSGPDVTDAAGLVLEAALAAVTALLARTDGPSAADGVRALDMMGLWLACQRGGTAERPN